MVLYIKWQHLEHHRDRTEVEATAVISMADNGDDKLHIAMFPWLAFGHLLPFLQLAKLMASKGHKISFISTPRNIDRLPKIPQPLTHLITFIQINLPKVQNLPENAESTRDLPINKGRYLKIAYDAVVVRSCFDFEPDWLNLLKKLYKKPVVPAGLLPAVVNDAGDGCWPEMKQWLDMHPKGSVVYIAFGTETKPNQYELTQLALGLELSGLPFLWVLIEGMSSMVEGLQLDKPLVLLPFMFDQGLIASYLVEKKMACMVHRDDVDGSFTPESVADSQSLVMVSEDGKMYGEKAKEMMPLFGDINVQDKCVDELLYFLQNFSKL
ncbi:hypothetical protein R6Q59_005760 [Mikania micrantha]